MILCGGNSREFRELLIEHGAAPKVFKPNDNIINYLEEHNCSFLLEDGVITSRVTTSDASVHTLFGVKPGTILPKFPNCFHCKVTPFEELSPFGKEARCLILPSETLVKLKSEEPRLAQAIERDSYSIISALAISSIAFHSGDGITRVANFLYCMHSVESDIGYAVEFNQDEIAAAINLSVSQVWRALSSLRKEQVIATSVGKIVITDLEKLKQFVSDIVLSYTCFTHN